MSNVDDSVGGHPFLIWQVLSVARTGRRLVNSEKIKEMDKELTKVIDDFSRAVHIRCTLRARV